MARKRRISGPSTHATLALCVVAVAFSEDDAVGVDAIQCLKAIGPPAAASLPALEAMLADRGEQARSPAADAIAAIERPGGPRSVGLRLEILGDADLARETRSAAIAAVRESSPARLPEVASIRAGQLSDPSPRVRVEAYRLPGEVIRDTPAPAPAMPVAGPRSAQVGGRSPDRPDSRRKPERPGDNADFPLTIGDGRAPPVGAPLKQG